MSELAKEWQAACRGLDKADAEIARLRADNEQLVGQLAGCGVAALQDTEESRKQRIGTDNPYYSASYGDICRRVDECIRLRAELAAAKEKLSKSEQRCPHCLGVGYFAGRTAIRCLECHGTGKAKAAKVRKWKENQFLEIKRLLFEAHNCVHRKLCGRKTTRQERRAFKAVVTALRYLTLYELEARKWEKGKE